MYRAVVAMRAIFNVFKQLAPFMSQKVLKKAQDSTRLHDVTAFMGIPKLSVKTMFNNEVFLTF